MDLGNILYLVAVIGYFIYQLTKKKNPAGAEEQVDMPEQKKERPATFEDLMREIREVVRDREILELHAIFRRVDVEGLVTGRHAVLVLVGPVAAYGVGHLENVERDTAILKGLGGGKAAAASANDAGLGQGAPSPATIVRT